MSISEPMDIEQQIRQALKSWYDGLQTSKANAGLPAKGTIGGALVVLEKMKDLWLFDIHHYQTSNGVGIAGLNGNTVSAITSRYGENRSLGTEVGRTNRGAPKQVASLLRTLKRLGINKITDEDQRLSIIAQCQKFLTAKVTPYFEQERIIFAYTPGGSTKQNIKSLLDAADSKRKSGAVAQYLVGAKLQLRFPNEAISNDKYTAADLPTGRHGDFIVGRTVFHVTVAAQQGHYEKCVRNLNEGYMVYLLVRERSLADATMKAEEHAPGGRITVLSIESYVGQNIDEVGEHGKNNRLNHTFLRLLQIYNERAAAIETTPAVLIEIPANLPAQA